MADRTKTRLTPAQGEQLIALANAGATSRETGKGPYELKVCYPVIIGILRDKGWADSRVVRKPGASQFTAYWLTVEGLAQARRLMEVAR